MNEFFGPGGVLGATAGRLRIPAVADPHGRGRPRALEEQNHVIIEAGTGTGKTLAYLLPALLHGRRILVSTGTKTLQDQIFYKDIPLLESILGRPIRAAYLKGRNNYLCRLKLETLHAEGLFTPRELRTFQVDPRLGAGNRNRRPRRTGNDRRRLRTCGRGWTRGATDVWERSARTTTDAS